MSKHYSLKSFLRHAPNALLDRYYQHKGIQLGLDFTKLKETKIDPVADALDALDEPVRQDIETDFTNIHMLANEAGYNALRQELQQSSQVLDEKPFIEAAFICFFDYPEAFAMARTFQLFFDQDRYWRRVKDIQAIMPTDPVPHSDRLAECLSAYFKNNEGRGRNCKVEYYARAGKHFFFAFPEDYPFQLMQWVKDEMQKTNVSPAFEVVFVYDAAAGTLDTHYEGTALNGRLLDGVFAEAVLGYTIPPHLYNKPVYALNKLKSPNFQFVKQPQDLIEKITVRKLRFDPKYQRKTKILVQSDVFGEKGQAALYDDIGLLFNMPGQAPDKRISYELLNVSWAEISVEFKSEGRKGTKRRTFSISAPSSCTLKHDGDDKIIRRILKDSGIEIPPANDQQADRQAA